MTPTIILMIALGLIVADIFLDLQLYAFSIALSFIVIAFMKFYEVELDYWLWSVVMAALTVFFVAVTRYFVKKTDNEDINKY